MATVATSVVIQCKDRNEYRRVGVHLKSCKATLDAMGEEHSFVYVARPIRMQYAGIFEEIDFEQWDDQFPVL